VASGTRRLQGAGPQALIRKSSGVINDPTRVNRPLNIGANIYRHVLCDSLAPIPFAKNWELIAGRAGQGRPVFGAILSVMHFA